MYPKKDTNFDAKIKCFLISPKTLGVYPIILGVFNYSIMKYVYDHIDYDHLRSLISKRGISNQNFCMLLFGKSTHQTVAYFKTTRDLRTSSLIKIASILDCSIDDLLNKEKEETPLPYKLGDSLKKEDKNGTTSQEFLIENIKSLLLEKDLRISDLQRHNNELTKCIDYMVEQGKALGNLKK